MTRPLLAPASDPLVEAVSRSLGMMIRLRDQATDDHCLMVGEMAGQLAAALGVDPAASRLIAIGGRLHDLGKVGIPDRILRNTDPLTDRELQIVKAHAANGQAVLEEMAALSPSVSVVAAIVGAHHERWNGAGYPRGLSHEVIPLGARIVAVVDAYSAATTKRTYQPAMGHDQALEQIAAGSGLAFDPEVVDAFMTMSR